MITNSPADPLAADHRPRFGVPFLASQRGLTACARELTRLGNEVVRGVTAMPGPAAEERTKIRRSPDRCIVQLGPVALTIAWLRGNHDTVADGELLVIVWHGAVAPRTRHQPERPVTGPAPLGATPLWEQVLVAVGDSEETWSWRRHDEESGSCSSVELAARCVDRLRAAYLEQEAPVPVGSGDLGAT